MRGFTETETKKLIETAKTYKETGKGLTRAFRDFAIASGRAQGSVRNYYYKTLKEGFKSQSRLEKLGIPERLRPAFINEFTKAEEVELLTGIFNGLADGKSVRKTVSDMAFGDQTLALRYQNKYRNLLKTNSPSIIEAQKRVKEERGYTVEIVNQKPRKNREYLKLEAEINAMLDRLLFSIKKENAELLAKTNSLEKENLALKSVVKETMREKNFTKEYFDSLQERKVF